ncbi:hypothetical protein PCASD_15218 [Puccinia coronata f. sp. avenae]|uniref:Uncharacterized protein n=1 Tax=Puccinia coronata f. sp. avenae TaxID=200324 RepID=A0A2N5T1E2_9BASI|nr:hypothetical protein PCASD_15218 [Puccinia coronata f. sp. avenae]
MQPSEPDFLEVLVTSLAIKIDVPLIFNDNSGAVVISKEPKLNPNTKHIEIRFQYIRQLINGRVMKIQQVSTVGMIADILTKPLGKIKLADACKQLHLTNSSRTLHPPNRFTYHSIIKTLIF